MYQALLFWVKIHLPSKNTKRKTGSWLARVLDLYYGRTNGKQRILDFLTIIALKLEKKNDNVVLRKYKEKNLNKLWKWHKKRLKSKYEMSIILCDLPTQFGAFLIINLLIALKNIKKNMLCYNW